MTAKIINFPGITLHNLDPRKILEAVLERVDEIESVLIIATDKDQEAGHVWASSSTSKVGDLLWMLERTKLTILRCGDD